MARIRKKTDETPAPQDSRLENPEGQAAEPEVEEAEAAEAVGEAEPLSPEPAVEPEKPKRTRTTKPKTEAKKPRSRTSAKGSSADRKPIVRLQKPEHERGPRKERRGVVVSASMDKTIVVRVD